MKFSKCLLTVSAAIAGMVLALDLPLQAQSLALKVNIPFEFHAGDKALPAGTYIVEKRGDAILISDGKGHATAVIANSTKNKAYHIDNMLVFRGYGDQRFLSEVRWSDYSTARSLMESKTERRLAKAITSEPVSLAASVR